MHQTQFQWAVVGAGPGGITAVGLLLDAGVLGKDILWIDPHFQAGDFGRLWGEVNSNTRVSLFLDYLNGVNHFNYSSRSKNFTLDTLNKNGFTPLKYMTEALLWVTERLREKVITQVAIVKTMTPENGCWKLHTSSGDFFSKKIILAIGAEEKSLDFPEIQKIDLVTALNPARLSQACNQNDTVAVFGSSHSAMIAIRNLIEIHVKHVVNFYLSPLRYAVLMDDWILYDDTGLKGETAAWVRENISTNCLPQISRYLSTPEYINEHLPRCNKVICAVGFQQRHIPISHVSLSQYDASNGIIAPGLFGIGIGFPITVLDPLGRSEKNVGVWKFLKNMRRTLPLWQRYDL